MYMIFLTYVSGLTKIDPVVLENICPIKIDTDDREIETEDLFFIL